MGNEQRWFQKHQTAAWVLWGNPPPGRLTCENVVVGIGIVTTKGQLETVLAGSRTMACAHVASRLGQHRNDMIPKAPFGSLINAASGYRSRSAQAADSSGNGRRSIGQRRDDARANLRDLGVANHEFGIGGDVFGIAVGIETLDDNPLTTAAAAQNDFGRKEFDGLKRLLNGGLSRLWWSRYRQVTNKKKEEGSSQQSLDKHRNLSSPSWFAQPPEFPPWS